MAKHDQQWRDTRWQRQEKQKAVEKKRRAWEKKERERKADKLLEEIEKFLDWAESRNGNFDVLKDAGPGIDFSKIVRGFVRQTYNGDGSYDVTFKTDVFCDGNSHEKVGTLTATMYGVTYIAGRIEVHGRNHERNRTGVRGTYGEI